MDSKALYKYHKSGAYDSMYSMSSEFIWFIYVLSRQKFKLFTNNPDHWVIELLSWTQELDLSDSWMDHLDWFYELDSPV